jgi:exodeoxyribonuclease VII large subunit
VGHKEAFEELLQRQQRTMEQNLMRHIEQLRQRFTAAAQSKSMREPQRLTESRGQVLDNLELRLVHGISAMGHDTRSKLEQARNRMVMAQMRAIPPLYDTLARLKRDLLRSASQLILQQRNKLAVQERSLRALGPQGVLQRGYSLTYTTDGVLVRDASQVTTGMIVKTELAQGSFESTVK